MEENITKPEDRTFCAKGCGNYLVHTPPGSRVYPDFCTECEKQILTTMSKKGGKLSKFRERKLKK